MIESYGIMSHDRSYDKYEKIVHRPYSSYISSIENLIETPSSFSCQLRLGVDLSCLS